MEAIRREHDGRNQPLVDAKALANLILDWADEDNIPISNMKLQKILFFCHADYVKSAEQPLIKEQFEAWDHGPVLSSLYREFREFGAKPISKRAEKFDPITAETTVAHVEIEEDIRLAIRSSYDFYKRIGTFTLSGLSHADEGPWAKARSLFDDGKNPDRRMNTELIARYHQEVCS